MSTTPKLSDIRRLGGVAGQYEISVDVQYPDEPAERVAFVGNTHGGPIVMVTSRRQVFVSRTVTERLGSRLDEQWVRGFFAGVAS